MSAPKDEPVQIGNDIHRSTFFCMKLEPGIVLPSGIKAHIRELDVRKSRLDVQQQSENINVDDNGHGEGPGLIRSRRSPR